MAEKWNKFKIKVKNESCVKYFWQRTYVEVKSVSENYFKSALEIF